MAEKINARLKRAYYYFGFNQVVPYQKVKTKIDILKKYGETDAILEKINGYSDEIEEFFDINGKKFDDNFYAEFSKQEPRKSWEQYSEDFPKYIFHAKIKLNKESIEYPKTKIFINGKLLGVVENPKKFINELKEKRRNGKVSHQMNVSYHEYNNEINIVTDAGRARRPLIVVKNGSPLLKEEHLNKLARGKLNWDNLINHGIIEFLDADEEENSYIATNLEDLKEEHTHLEIDPSTMLGICAGSIPFSNHNYSPRNTVSTGLMKQSIGIYASNYAMRTDEKAHLLHYPQTPIVKTRINDTINYDSRSAGQNFVVALMSYEGYNMEDALVINKSSLERGLGRSSFFRTYATSDMQYDVFRSDKIEIPTKNTQGYRSEEAYKNLDKGGLIYPESYVESGDVLIGKTSPPKFLEYEFQNFRSNRRETSITVRHGEKGIVDEVMLSETSTGSNLAKVRLRDTRQPEFGDKFASKHGHKGVIGLILSPEDMPFNECGIMPDLIVNPHAIPSRMSIGFLLEMIAGKAGSLEGKRVDATPFNPTLEDEIKQHLIDNGFESAGCESLYDGVTGERFDAEIFMGMSHYQRLHHMASDKIFARSRGPVQILTRQPTEGKELQGGLRFGEMERDALIAHGAAITLKERLLDESDKYGAVVCDNCGMLAIFDKNKNRKYCPICGGEDTLPVEISYAFKLLLDELKSLCIYPKLVLGEKGFPSYIPLRKSSFKVKPLEENKIFISRIRLSEEEPIFSKSDDDVGEKLEYCEICGKKLSKNQNKICKNCARKQYASRIIKKLSNVVKPEVPFHKSDLKSLNLVDLQIQDYIWTLQEFDLIYEDNNKFTLKDGKTLNDFRVESGFDPIDFENIEGVDKTCKTCGKTLPLSKFYKTSEGYEDNCKDCKRLISTAKNLKYIISFIGFNKEFTEDDLKKHISNPNKLIGIIWALQDQDLLNKTESDKYILDDKSKCLKFMEKYLDNSEFEEIKHQKKTEENNIKQNKLKSNETVVEKNNYSSNDENIGKIKTKSKSTNVKAKSKARRGLGKSDILTNVKINDNKVNHDSKNANEKKEIMGVVLNARGEGKTREEAAKIAGIPLHRLNHWYREGRQGFGNENIEFYKKLKKIENNLLNSSDSIERKNMEFVLKLLRQGKTKKEVAEFTNLNQSTLTSWYNQGKEKRNKNTTYFYNEVKKINTNKKNKESIDSNKTHKLESENKHADSSRHDDKKENEKNKIKAKELKLKIKEFIPKFVELDEKLDNAHKKTGEFISIRKQIRSNIKVLKQSSRLRRIDKLENRLSNAKTSYDELKTKADNYLINNNAEKLIKENVKRIIKLRNQFQHNPFVLDELMEISFLNSKLNAKLKKRKYVKYEDAVKIKERLDNIKSHSSNSFKSKNVKPASHIKKNNIKKSTKEKFKKSKQELDEVKDNHLSSAKTKKYNKVNKLELSSNEEFNEAHQLKKQYYKNKKLLTYLYFITGSNDISPKESYVHYIKSNDLSLEDGIQIKNALKSEIFDGKLETTVDVKNRLDELINQKRSNKKENLLKVLHSFTGKDSSLKQSYISNNNANDLAVTENSHINKVIENEIVEGIITSPEEIKSRMDELIKQSDKRKLIEYLDSIVEVNELKFSENNLEKKDINEIKNKLLKKINDFELKSENEIHSLFIKLIDEKQLENNKLLIRYLNSIMESNELKFSENNLDKDAVNEIRDKIIKEINDFELKSKDNIYNRFNELLEKSKKEQFNNVLDYFYDSVGEKNISDSFLEKLSDEGLSLNNAIYIKNVVEEKILNGSINKKLDIDREISNLITDEVNRQNRSLNKLNELYKNDNVYLIGFTADEKKEIKDMVIKSIKENRLNYLSVYFEFKKVIEEFKKTKVVEDNNDIEIDEEEHNEEKSSKGLMSKLKGIFSSKK